MNTLKHLLQACLVNVQLICQIIEYTSVKKSLIRLVLSESKQSLNKNSIQPRHN